MSTSITLKQTLVQKNFLNNIHTFTSLSALEQKNSKVAAEAEEAEPQDAEAEEAKLEEAEAEEEASSGIQS